jgi:hypothetical protein
LGAQKTVRKHNENPYLRSAHGCFKGKTGVYCYECHEELLHNPVEVGCWGDTQDGTRCALYPASLKISLLCHTTDFLFDVSKDSRGLRLLVTEDTPETRLVVGHENSLLHKKIYFGLDGAPLLTNASR